ncbi:hypothetical protein SU32_14155 [Ahrensia marina]|uniref:Uncharacterized protein n=1 Tax=Ahrensia marina TaxID=1514904 RepID=A0A0M9GL78_9HYPH|nr:hypothetical protein SU32_14155 [Ahrensia marina]
MRGRFPIIPGQVCGLGIMVLAIGVSGNATAQSEDLFKEAERAGNHMSADRSETQALQIAAGEMFDLSADNDAGLTLKMENLSGTLLTFPAVEETEEAGEIRYYFQAPPVPGKYEIHDRNNGVAATIEVVAPVAKLLAPTEVDLCDKQFPVRFKGPKSRFDRLEITPANASASPHNGYKQPSVIKTLNAESSSTVFLDVPEEAGAYRVGYFTQSSMAIYRPIAEQEITVTADRACKANTAGSDKPEFNPSNPLLKVLSGEQQ